MIRLICKAQFNTKDSTDANGQGVVVSLDMRMVDEWLAQMHQP